MIQCWVHFCVENSSNRQFFLFKAGEEQALFSRKNGEIQICQEKKRVLLRFSNKFFLEVVTVLQHLSCHIKPASEHEGVSVVTLHMQVFSEKCELPCELSQSNLLLSEPDQSALCRDWEKCIFRAFHHSEKSTFYVALIMQYAPLPLKFT